MSFTPKTTDNIRVRATNGRFAVEQSFIASPRGRYYDDDELPAGTEDWFLLQEFTNFNEAVLAAFVLMLEENYQLRIIESDLLTGPMVSQALSQLNQFVIP